MYAALLDGSVSASSSFADSVSRSRTALSRRASLHGHLGDGCAAEGDGARVRRGARAISGADVRVARRLLEVTFSEEERETHTLPATRGERRDDEAMLYAWPRLTRRRDRGSTRRCRGRQLRRDPHRWPSPGSTRDRRGTRCRGTSAMSVRHSRRADQRAVYERIVRRIRTDRISAATNWRTRVRPEASPDSDASSIVPRNSGPSCRSR